MNTKPTVIDHFSSAARSYDEKNQQLAPLADDMHFLIRLILKNAPVRARVLCVGVGTGADILARKCISRMDLRGCRSLSRNA